MEDKYKGLLKELAAKSTTNVIERRCIESLSETIRNINKEERT